jgi:ribitol-5-phosphate 2-dehydrogenase
MILEKGLNVFGSSRSGVQDFRDTIQLYNSNKDVEEYLESIIGETITVRSIADMNRAFDADIRKSGGKTVMVWEK